MAHDASELLGSKQPAGNWEFEVSPLIRQKVVQVVRALGY
jgi:hypothetical protein